MNHIGGGGQVRGVQVELWPDDLVIAVLLLGAFAVNGLSFANGIVPLVGEETGIAPSVPST